LHFIDRDLLALQTLGIVGIIQNLGQNNPQNTENRKLMQRQQQT